MTQTINSQSLLSPFVDNHVQVDTPVGSVQGLLKAAGESKHGGIGALLLMEGDVWILVKEWCTVKIKGREELKQPLHYPRSLLIKAQELVILEGQMKMEVKAFG